MRLIPSEIGQIDMYMGAVTGDGTIVSLPTPGHTRGHQSHRDDGCRLLYGHDHQQFAALPAEGLS